MRRGPANDKRVEVVRGYHSRNNVSNTVGERVTAKSTRMDAGPVPLCTLEEYWGVCAGPIDVKSFGAKAGNGNSLIMYDGYRFERDMALGAWKR